MLNSEIKSPEEPISAVIPSTRTGQIQREAARDDRNGPVQTTRFVAGARAILLLSLACWAAVLGAALLLFG